MKNKAMLSLFTAAVTLSVSSCGLVIQRDTGTPETAVPASSAPNTAAPVVTEQPEVDFNKVVADNNLSDAFLLLPDDYDKDGRNEAFVLSGTLDPEWSFNNRDTYNSIYVWFINSDGEMSFVDYTDLMGNYTSTVETSNGKFIVLEVTAGGSSSTSLVYGCKNGDAFIPYISGISGGFQMKDGKYIYYANDFSKGFHDYVETEVFYDPDTMEFVLY